MSGTAATDFDPQHVAQRWKSFIDDRDDAADAPDGVRDVIAESWRRCKALEIDARLGGAPFVGASELAAIQLHNEALIDAAQLTWDVLAASLIASDSIFVLTDANGVVLDTRGNDEIVNAAAKQHVAPGFDWSEEAAGTNAVGTAIANRAPTVVRSAEHYCATAKVWDCAATTISDLTDGTILGVLNVTSVGDLSDSHTLALAITAAKHCEHTLHSRELAHCVQLLNWYRKRSSNDAKELTVLLDSQGRIITSSNNLAGKLASVAIEIIEKQPVIPSEPSLKIERIIPYQWPPDVPRAGIPNGWLGGIVVFETDEQSIRELDINRNDKRNIHTAFDSIISNDAGIKEAINNAARMARTTAPVLITGETGCGKELFATAIHNSSEVDSGPFVAVNCGTLTRELAASELFGYAKGAFTGASNQGRVGKFEQAHNGTLFLDEIGELPIDVQVHLLRVLQDGVIIPIGGNDERNVTVRVIAATNRDLEKECSNGKFRSDLFFRLSGLTIKIPPLRERPDDIALLLDQHLRDLQGKYGLGLRSVSVDLLRVLQKNPWPGNVRELFGMLESMYILSDQTTLNLDDLPNGFREKSRDALGGKPTVPGNTHSKLGLRDIERDTIIHAIASAKHNMSKAAESLGISRSTLYRKIRSYDIVI